MGKYERFCSIISKIAKEKQKKMKDINMSPAIFADLHNHTTASDGDFSPKVLVNQAVERGIRKLGVTDHDTLVGLSGAMAAAKGTPVDIVPGVEVSLGFRRSTFTGTLHLLCYFDPGRLEDESFVLEFAQILNQGRGEGLVRARMEKINAWFGPRGKEPLLDREMVFKDLSSYGTNISRRHFALALAEKLGIQDGGIRNRILANQSPAYLPSGIPLSLLAGFIKKGGLLPVLAHPAAGSYPGEGHYKEVLPPLDIVEGLLPEFMDAGLAGLEVHYPGHTPELEERLMVLAGKMDLLVTGGSDCHGDAARPVGVSGMSEAEFQGFETALARV